MTYSCKIFGHILTTCPSEELWLFTFPPSKQFLYHTRSHLSKDSSVIAAEARSWSSGVSFCLTPRTESTTKFPELCLQSLSFSDRFSHLGSCHRLTWYLSERLQGPPHLPRPRKVCSPFNRQSALFEKTKSSKPRLCPKPRSFIQNNAHSLPRRIQALIYQALPVSFPNFFYSCVCRHKKQRSLCILRILALSIRSHWYFSTSTPAFFIAFTDCFDI